MLKPLKAHLDHAQAKLPTEKGAEFQFRDLIADVSDAKGKKRAGDDANIPQAAIDARARSEAETQAELAARQVREAALSAGEIEFVGMGRFRKL